MRVKHRAFIVVVIATISCLCVALAQSTELGEDIEGAFPLTKGTYWVYEGIVKWFGADKVDADGKVLTWKVAEKTLTWKMEVLETITRGHVKTAVMKGHPGDLISYEGKDIDRSDYLIVQVGRPGKFYKLSGERAEEALKRLKDRKYADRHFFPGDKKYSLGYLGIGDEPFLDLPLQVGKVFGSSEWITRIDKQYCWVVESEDEVKLRDIKGIRFSHKMTQYRLAYRTNPDHFIVEFVPGIGITRYVYSHHGTPMDVDLRLIEYHSGKEDISGEL